MTSAGATGCVTSTRRDRWASRTWWRAKTAETSTSTPFGPWSPNRSCWCGTAKSLPRGCALSRKIPNTVSVAVLKKYNGNDSRFDHLTYSVSWLSLCALDTHLCQRMCLFLIFLPFDNQITISNTSKGLGRWLTVALLNRKKKKSLAAKSIISIGEYFSPHRDAKLLTHRFDLSGEQMTAVQKVPSVFFFFCY